MCSSSSSNSLEAKLWWCFLLFEVIYSIYRIDIDRELLYFLIWFPYNSIFRLVLISRNSYKILRSGLEWLGLLIVNRLFCCGKQCLMYCVLYLSSLWHITRRFLQVALPLSRCGAVTLRYKGILGSCLKVWSVYPCMVRAIFIILLQLGEILVILRGGVSGMLSFGIYILVLNLYGLQLILLQACDMPRRKVLVSTQPASLTHIITNLTKSILILFQKAYSTACILARRRRVNCFLRIRRWISIKLLYCLFYKV